MGGLNPPVPQQDNNWEIRVAVLLSLFFQVLILFIGPMRKRSSSPVALFAIWSCYLLADWVADLALGLLLNNMGNIGGNGGSSSSSGGSGTPNTGSPIIFAFWTPFLLLHLGGQDTMTAYSIQDNDLWLRHLIGLLFELFSACVIFFCSLQGNPMIPATILMFVVGIIKYGERTYSLYSGSIDGVLAGIIGDPDPGPNYAKLMTEFDTKEKAGLDVEIAIVGGEAMRASETVRHLVKLSNRSLEAQAYYFFNIYRKMCFDVKLSKKEREIGRSFFLERTQMTSSMAFQVVEVELNFIYEMVHTKAIVAHSKAGCVLRFVGSTCIVSALLIFFFHHKGDFTRVDVAITYALLLGGLALDIATLVMLLISNWTLVFLEEIRRLAWLARAVKSLQPRQRRWREDILQLSLVSYCLHKPDPYAGDRVRHRFSSPRVVRAFSKVADKLHIREVFDDFFFIQRESLSYRQREGLHLLVKFVFEVLKDNAIAAKSVMDEQTTKMCNYRGDGVLIYDEYFREEIVNSLIAHEKVVEKEVIRKLVNEKLDVLRGAVLVGGVQREFDESLLLWHIATDLCFHPLTEYMPENKRIKIELQPISKTLSEYMLYLLIKQPKILLASAGIGLSLQRYQDTCAEARRFFESSAAWDPNHDDARKMLLSVNTSKKPSDVKGGSSKSVLFDAVILAKALRDLGVELMWEVVARVWAEMFTYAASKCKGSTHVQQLSRGGEFITMVWLLMAHMGLTIDDVDKTGPEIEPNTNQFIAKLIVHDQ